MIGWISDNYCSIKPLCSGMGEVVPARTSLTLLPPSPSCHPLALYCNYPVSKCCSASLVATSTVRVKPITLQCYDLCFSGGKLKGVCDKIRLPDDCSLGYIISKLAFISFLSSYAEILGIININCYCGIFRLVTAYFDKFKDF